MNNENPSAEYLDSDAAPEQPGWPKTVGIISIVWASLGFVCNSCGVAGPMIQRFSLSLVPPEKQAEVQQQMAASQQPAFVYVFMVGKIVLAVLLLAAGISLLGRKAVARHLHLGWSTLALLLVIGGLVLGILNAPEQAKKTQDALTNSPAGGMSFMMMTSPRQIIIASVVGALVTGVWPLFCLIWFGVMKKRPEVGKLELPV